MFKKVLLIDGFTNEEELLEQIDGVKPQVIIINKLGELLTSQIGKIVSCICDNYSENEIQLMVAETHTYKP